MADQALVNYYQLLHVSPDAPPKLIELAARLIGSQYHPKHPTTGDAAKYELVKVAYRTLSDPESRKQYDEEVRLKHEVDAPDLPRMRPAAQIGGTGRDLVRHEVEKRRRIMGMLYAQLLDDPDNPGVSTAELVQTMGMQRDQMIFALWFLREKGLARVTDKGVYSLTTNGCSWVEDGGVPDYTYTPDEEVKGNLRALPAPVEKKQANAVVELEERVADNRG